MLSDGAAHGNRTRVSTLEESRLAPGRGPQASLCARAQRQARSGGSRRSIPPASRVAGSNGVRSAAEPPLCSIVAVAVRHFGEDPTAPSCWRRITRPFAQTRFSVVRRTGLEPVRPGGRQPLELLRLPIPPSAHGLPFRLEREPETRLVKERFADIGSAQCVSRGHALEKPNKTNKKPGALHVQPGLSGNLAVTIRLGHKPPRMPGLSARPVETGLATRVIAIADGRCRLQARWELAAPAFPGRARSRRYGLA